MARIWNKNWLEDDDLKTELARYVREGLSRSEILNFVSRDYSVYAWSIRTLDRSLREYQKHLTVDNVRRAVEIELAGRESNSDTEPWARKSDSCVRSMYHEVLCMM